MPKFNKTENELEGMFDKWLFVLRNLSSLFERPKALQNRVFDRLFETAEISKFTKTELNEYWDSLKNFRDWYSALSTAEKKGFETGVEKGFERGIEQGIEKGIEQGIEKGIEQGIEKGIEKGLQKGREEGKKEGREEGLREGNLNNARNLKKMGITTDIISQATGLTEMEIEKL